MDTDVLDRPEVGEVREFSLPTKISRGKNDPEVFSFIISKEEEDRHGTVIKVDGIDVTHFKANPVVLFNHNNDRVIGTAFNVRVVGDTLQADMRFAQTEFAQEIKGQVDRGEIRATSIGFIVNEWSFDEENDQWKVLRSELLEFSIVSVPSNRSALIMRDVQVKSLKQALDKQNVINERILATLERLAPKINGEELIESVTKTDQPNELAPDDTSTRNAPDAQDNSDELANQDEPLPGEADAENDQGHDTEQRTANPTNQKMTLEEAMDLCRSVVRRKLGKE